MTIDIISMIIGAILWELLTGYIANKKERVKAHKATKKKQGEVVSDQESKEDEA